MVVGAGFTKKAGMNATSVAYYQLRFVVKHADASTLHLRLAIFHVKLSTHSSSKSTSVLSRGRPVSSHPIMP